MHCVAQLMWCSIILVLVHCVQCGIVGVVYPESGFGAGEPCGTVDMVCHGTDPVVCRVLQLVQCTMILVWVCCMVWCTMILVLVLVSPVV